MNDEAVRCQRLILWYARRGAEIGGLGPDELRAVRELGPLDPSEPEAVGGAVGPERPGRWFVAPGGQRVFAPTQERATNGELLAVMDEVPTYAPARELLAAQLQLVYHMGRIRGRGEPKASSELSAELEAAVRERTIRECATALRDCVDMHPEVWLLKRTGLEP